MISFYFSIKSKGEHDPKQDYEVFERIPELVEQLEALDTPDFWEALRYMKHEKYLHRKHYGHNQPYVSSIRFNGLKFRSPPKYPKPYVSRYRKVKSHSFTNYYPIYRKIVPRRRVSRVRVANYYYPAATNEFVSVAQPEEETLESRIVEQKVLPGIKLPTSYLYPNYPEVYSSYKANFIASADSSKGTNSDVSQDSRNITHLNKNEYHQSIKKYIPTPQEEEKYTYDKIYDISSRIPRLFEKKTDEKGIKEFKQK